LIFAVYLLIVILIQSKEMLHEYQEVTNELQILIHT